MRSRGLEARVKNQGDEFGDYYYHPQGDLNHKVVNIKEEKVFERSFRDGSRT